MRSEKTTHTHVRTNSLAGLHIDLGTSRALVALSRHDLVVVLAQVQAVAGPSIEVILHVDAAADTLGGANRPVLLESAGSVDGGLVGTGGDRDIVCAAVGLEAALARGTAAGVVRAVLYERVSSPAVDGEVAVALGVEGAAVVDGAEYER
jgi:hypothetical protein